LRPPLRDIVANRRIRDRRDAVLVDQPRQHPPRGMPLLLRRIQVLTQHRVDPLLQPDPAPAPETPAACAATAPRSPALGAPSAGAPDAAAPAAESTTPP